MDYNHPIMIMLVNMHKRNAVTHALLNSDRFTNIFLIQEPWYDTIGTTRKDTSCQGVDILEGVASPGWEVLYLKASEGQRPKVMAYACKQATNTQHEPPFTLVPHLDIAAHPCIQVLDTVFNKETWHIINFYHDV